MTPRADDIRIAAKPGPQTDALSSEADLLFFGGEAGGGKTFVLSFDPVSSGATEHRGFRAAYFRKDSKRFGELWKQMTELYPYFGGRGTESELRWSFKSGARIGCHHLRNMSDAEAHRGQAYAAIYFDEVTEIGESEFFFLLSRNRTNIAGFKPYVRCTCNPQSEGWVRRLLAWWIDEKGWPITERLGKLRWFARDAADKYVWGDTREEVIAKLPDAEPLSLSFIRSGGIVEELGEDYRAKLRNQHRTLRLQLEKGNWNAREAKGSYFHRNEMKLVRSLPASAGPVVRRIRFWDLASTKPNADRPEPDYTRGAKLAWTSEKNLVIEGMASLRDGPGEVEALVKRMAKLDNDVGDVFAPRERAVPVEVGLFQDPGQAGKHQFHTFAQRLSGFIVSKVPARQNKETMARVWSPWGEQGRIYVIDGDYVEELFTELEDFPFGVFDDQVDAISGGVQALTMRTSARFGYVKGA